MGVCNNLVKSKQKKKCNAENEVIFGSEGFNKEIKHHEEHKIKTKRNEK